MPRSSSSTTTSTRWAACARRMSRAPPTSCAGRRRARSTWSRSSRRWSPAAMPMSPKATCCSTCPRCRPMAGSPAARSTRWSPAPASTWRPTSATRWTSCCGSPPTPTQEPGWDSRRGASAGRAGTSNARRCPARCSARSSTSTAAASTSSSRTTRTRSRKAAARSAPRRMAAFWMHNGFLMVEGEKMSKSLGNFVTIRELLASDKFGGQNVGGRRAAPCDAQDALPPADRLDRRRAARERQHARRLVPTGCVGRSRRSLRRR